MWTQSFSEDLRSLRQLIGPAHTQPKGVSLATGSPDSACNICDWSMQINAIKLNSYQNIH